MNDLKTKEIPSAEVLSQTRVPKVKPVKNGSPGKQSREIKISGPASLVSPKGVAVIRYDSKEQTLKLDRKINLHGEQLTQDRSHLSLDLKELNESNRQVLIQFAKLMAAWVNGLDPKTPLGSKVIDGKSINTPSRLELLQNSIRATVGAGRVIEVDKSPQPTSPDPKV
jgi:hypothetical protein